MLPELAGLPLEAAEAALREAGVDYTLVRTETPFGRPPESGREYRDYAVRFVQGELTYASFPVASFTATEDTDGI